MLRGLGGSIIFLMYVFDGSSVAEARILFNTGDSFDRCPPPHSEQSLVQSRLSVRMDYLLLIA